LKTSKRVFDKWFNFHIFDIFSGFVGMRGKKGQRYMGKPILPDVLQRYVRAGFVGMRG
jgi:hypothetical protein